MNSNNKDKQQLNTPNAENDVMNSSTIKKWSFTSQDLQSALQRWDQSSKEAIAIAPDEKQLQDVRSLLNHLKNKLEEFE